MKDQTVDSIVDICNAGEGCCLHDSTVVFIQGGREKADSDVYQVLEQNATSERQGVPCYTQFHQRFTAAGDNSQKAGYSVKPRATSYATLLKLIAISALATYLSFLTWPMAQFISAAVAESQRYHSRAFMSLGAESESSAIWDNQAEWSRGRLGRINSDSPTSTEPELDLMSTLDWMDMVANARAQEPDRPRAKLPHQGVPKETQGNLPLPLRKPALRFLSSPELAAFLQDTQSNDHLS